MARLGVGMICSYTKEEIEKQVKVKESVTQELEAMISDQLKKCGIFHRVFSRIKSADSLAHKFSSEKYGDEADDKKIQDLLGVRIVVYFWSDLEICKRILESCFKIADEWSESDGAVNTFEQSKINGVFHLPEYLLERISPKTWEMGIDKTFEAQIKTVFFEGWHETEHDMRYKNKEVWQDYPSTERRLNSVIATLELCDNATEGIFEDFAHDLYKAKDFENMIPMHFRLKFRGEEMYAKYKEILQRNNTLAKLLYKCDRDVLIMAYLEQRMPIPITVNTAIELLNKRVLQNEELDAAIAIRRQERLALEPKNKGRKRLSQTALLPITQKGTFDAKVYLKGNASEDEIFVTAAEIIYSWLYTKYHVVFPQLPEVFDPELVIDEHLYTNGFMVDIRINSMLKELSLKTSHIATNVIGRIYETKATIKRDAKGLFFCVENAYLDHNENSQYDKVGNFSCPKFYYDICKNDSIEAIDICPITEKCVKTKDVELIRHMWHSKDRQFPVVCLVRNGKVGMSADETDRVGGWIGSNWINKLCENAWCYSHIFELDREDATLLFGKDEEKEKTDTIYVLPIGKEIQKWENGYLCYTGEDTKTALYDWRLGYEREEKLHNFLRGSGALRHILVNELKLMILDRENGE